MLLGHAKWFVPDPNGYDFDPGFLFSPWTLIPLLAICAAGAVAWRRRPRGRAAEGFPFAAHVPRALAAVAGASLLLVAVRGDLLVPSMAAPSGVVGAIEAAVGAWLLAGARPHAAAWALLAFSIAAAVVAAPLALLETAVYPGIATYLILDRHAREGEISGRAPWRALSIAVGVSLIVVAFTEKLAVPDMGAAILYAHPGLDPLAALGTPLPTETFIRAVGLIEVLAGLLVATGIGGRVVPIALIGPFVATVPIFGLTELSGHAPICVALVAIAAQTAPITARNTAERSTKRR
jgi:hypothetical protein